MIGETALVNKEDEDDALLLERNGYNSRNESSERSSKQSQQYPLANVKLSLFEGLSIEEKELAVNLISRLSGEYLRAIQPPRRLPQTLSSARRCLQRARRRNCER